MLTVNEITGEPLRARGRQHVKIAAVGHVDALQHICGLPRLFRQSQMPLFAQPLEGLGAQLDAVLSSGSGELALAITPHAPGV